ncbi:MAG: exodeoxyribonuclease small subunit [Gammaproteobacteria bacterium]|jgi:exodeoxyribonuclease VII small subunit|nr:exodeoxyribonuclease small subunit [Gammaproteobacteria bacterium]
MTAEKKPFVFEKAISSLEEIVESIETGELSLDASLKQFEKGIQLTRECHQALTEAEQKVQILIQQNGQETLTDFDNEDI